MIRGIIPVSASIRDGGCHAVTLDLNGFLQICDADALRTCLRAQKGSLLLRRTGTESVHQQYLVAPAGDLIKSDKLHRYPVTLSQMERDEKQCEND